MKNLYITGGLGQDGKILSNIISKKKFKLFILSKKLSSIKIPGVKIFKCNLFNKNKILKILNQHKPDIILHLAANNPAHNEKGFKKFYLDNLNSSLNIFNASYEVNKNINFIFSSSVQIFKKKIGFVNENSNIAKTSPYTKFRIKFDDILSKKQINYTNIILFNHDSKFRNKKFLFPRLFKSLKNNNLSFLKEIVKNDICGDFSHAEDICKGIYKIILSKKKIKRIILSSGKSTSVNEIIKHVIKKNKINIKLKVKSKKKNCLKGNNSYAKKIINYKPKKNIFIAADEIYKSL